MNMPSTIGDPAAPNSHEPASNDDSPSAAKRTFASPLTPVWMSGFVLAACFFLPLCLVQGCQGSPPTPLYPVQCYADCNSVGQLALANSICWPYLFGAVVGCATLATAAGDGRGFKALWWLFAAVIAFASALWWIAMAIEFVETTGGGSATWTMPWVWMACALIATYRKNLSWKSAALWMQLALAVLSSYLFALLVILDHRMVLLGGKVSLAASLVIAAVTLLQLCEDGLRFNLKVLFAAMTWSAMAIAIATKWQAIGFSIFAFCVTMLLFAWLELRPFSVHRRTWTSVAVSSTYLIIAFITALLTGLELRS